MTPLRTRVRRDDAGMTVIELGVVMLILSIVLIIALGFLNQLTITAGTAESNVAAERDGQLALRTITQDLRAANPINSACASAGGSFANCINFEIQRPTNSNPDCVSVMEYSLSGGWVVQDRTDTGCASNRVWTDRPIIEVQNTSSGVNLFSYTDRLGKSISPTASCAGDPLTAPCPKHSKSVTTTLVVKYRNTSNPLRLTSVASVRNNR